MAKLEDVMLDISSLKLDLLKNILDFAFIDKEEQTIKRTSVKSNEYVNHAMSEFGLPTKDNITTTIEKLFCNGWAQAVQTMGEWYATNIHEYNQSGFTPCNILPDCRKVRHDCSGFTTACLWLYGVLLELDYPPTSYMYSDGFGMLYSLLERAGFQQMRWTSWEDTLPYDIVAFHGHVEIYNGKVDGKHTSWSWGSCHDKDHKGLPCGTAHASQGYEVIWRCYNQTQFSSNFINLNNSMGSGNGVFVPISNGGTVVNGKIGKFNVNSACTHLYNNSAATSKHECAGYVRRAIEAGGISTAGRSTWAWQYHTKGYLQKIGFAHIASIRGVDDDNWTKAHAQPGDIAVMPKPGSEGTHPGHIAMWSGKQWISDFRQNHAYVYRSLGPGQLEIYRYVG